MPHCTGQTTAPVHPYGANGRRSPPTYRHGVDLTDIVTTNTITPAQAIIAVLVVIAGWIVSSLAKRWSLALLRRVQGLSEAAAALAARVVRYSLLLLALGIALTVLGAPLQPVLAAVIIVAAICFLALRGIAENFGAGLVIQARRSVKVGDEIEVLGFTGVVKELNGRAVVLHTVDGKTVHVPNSDLLQSPVTSDTERGLARSEIELRAQTTLHYREVQRIAHAAVESTAHVRSVPGVQVLLAAHSPEAMTMRIRFWHPPAYRAEMRSACVCSLVDAFEKTDATVSVIWTVPPPPLTPAPPF